MTTDPALRALLERHAAYDTDLSYVEGIKEGWSAALAAAEAAPPGYVPEWQYNAAVKEGADKVAQARAEAAPLDVVLDKVRRLQMRYDPADVSAPYTNGWYDGRGAAEGVIRDALAATSREGFVGCPVCHEPERSEDMVTGVCLSCADAIAWGQNARRGAVNVPPSREGA